MSETTSTLTWREIQDHLDKGVLPEKHAIDYLGDLLSVVAVQAPEILGEPTQGYGLAAPEEGFPATESADL